MQEQSPRSRRLTPGPEIEFLRAAVASAQEDGLWHGADPIFWEPALPTGFPDLVGVVPRQRDFPFKRERLDLRGEHLQLLHYIFSTRGTSVTAAADALLWSQQILETMVEELELAELVRRRSSRVRCVALAEIFLAKRIVAVEAKIDKWERAIQQAVANTWFASESFILVPEKRWSEDLRSTASSFGIGVLTFDGSRSRRRLRATTRRIPASYGSWLVNEWALRHAGRPIT